MDKFTWLIGLLVLAVGTHAQAFQVDDERNAAQQAEFDRACEAARAVKLAPFRQQAFVECMKSKRSADSAEDCKRKTSAANLNIQGGSTRFYDLPACVEAFEFRKKHPRKS
ncbi:MAG: hypothetical protein WA173_00295 [Pseudomonas sp.]|uniref:hypothetical protein n=1 Tax=Pseudomonas sp. TaxID=306 RepID=UPI003BB8024E